jgi:hypothetical protein
MIENLSFQKLIILGKVGFDLFDFPDMNVIPREIDINTVARSHTIPIDITQ